MKKTSKFKKFVIAAMCAVAGLSGAASIAGTYAWFVASNSVSVSGMNIKAQAEEGIVMANETHTANNHWANTITASHNGQDGESKALAYIPTSTANCSDWYHANSNNVDNHAHVGDYETLTVTAPTEISGYGNGVATNASTNGNAAGKNIYFLNKFYLQASAQADLEHQDVVLTDLVVTESASAQDLNKALRIGIKYNTSNVVIFNALGTTTTAYNVNGSTAVSLQPKPVESPASNHYTLGSDVTIKAYTMAGTNATPISVYMWFEGEDINCKSANIAADMNSISVTFKIANKAHVNP